MRFQRKEGLCGPTCVVNALECLGLQASMKKVRADAGANTKEGAEEHGLKQALSRAGAQFQELSAGFDEAYVDLHYHLEHGGPAIILVERGDHWVNAIGILGPRIVVFNPDDVENPENKAAHGIQVLTKRQLKKFWTPYDGKRYALLVSEA